LFFSALIVGLRGDSFLTGTLAIVVLGQCALLPFLSLAASSSHVSPSIVTGGATAFGLIVLGLYLILRLTGGKDFLDRLALLSLLAVLPQAVLWLTFKVVYPFFDVQYLLLRLLPLYLAAIVVAALPARFSEPGFSGVPWTEILASSAAAGLLIIAISLGAHSLNAMNSGNDDPFRQASLQCSVFRPPPGRCALLEPPLRC